VVTFLRFIKLRYIHNDQPGDDFNDIERDQPQNAQDEQSPHISRDNELKKNDRNQSDDAYSAPQECLIVPDNDPPSAVFTVKFKRVKEECHSPEREWKITSRTMRFSSHFG
jgi:hypothetical protein